MATVTVTKNENIKNKTKEFQKAVIDKDLDVVLKNVKKIDNTCSFTKCKTRTSDFAITCKYCSGRFCTTHGLPEIHGCGDAVRKDEKQKFLHPGIKLSQEKHSQASTKLTMKLKQMELERKAKPSKSKKK
ncbi:PREDICTED: DNA-binding protein SMUBP-2 [Nicrophorus vespilloides]|uniref:DNA-binding protein SMUBP-2 n=1 Tax=Nicrophorus vespilloides TaxID=110193 RepID=A0ABM1MCR7_NICVS|nr:PREDICTED: DNA-binding protein SMUBP-2 [Nicrophorus vespilloides]